MQGREGNKKHSWKNYQWLSYQALPGAQWEVSTLAAAFIHLLGDFWLILSELLVRSPAGVCSTIHSEPSCINQCWMVANKGEKLTNKSVPAVCRAHLILNNFAISVTLCGHHTGRVLALQKHKAFDSSIYILTPIPPALERDSWNLFSLGHRALLFYWEHLVTSLLD